MPYHFHRWPHPDPVISRQIHDLHLRESLCQKARQKSLRGCGKDHIYLLRQFFQIVILQISSTSWNMFWYT